MTTTTVRHVDSVLHLYARAYANTGTTLLSRSQLERDIIGILRAEEPFIDVSTVALERYAQYMLQLIERYRKEV